MTSTLAVCAKSVVLLWRHNGHDSVSNHQPHDCLLNHLFRRRSKKTSKLRVTGLCAGNSPVTSEFPAQMVSNAQNVSIWWRHHGWRCFSRVKSLTHYSDVACSSWSRKSTKTRIVVLKLVQTKTKEIKNSPHHWLFLRNLPVTGSFPTQTASNPESISMAWLHETSWFFLSRLRLFTLMRRWMYFPQFNSMSRLTEAVDLVGSEEGVYGVVLLVTVAMSCCECSWERLTKLLQTIF